MFRRWPWRLPGPLTFALSNAPGYVPLAGFNRRPPSARSRAGRHRRRLPSVVRETLRFQTFGGYVELFRDKWDWTWHWFEIPNNDDFYYMRAQVPVLRWLPVTFWLIAPLALAGLALAATRIRAAWTLYLIVASVVAPLVIFYVLGRFRTALVAAALPFAAHAAVQIHLAERAGAPGSRGCRSCRGGPAARLRDGSSPFPRRAAHPSGRLDDPLRARIRRADHGRHGGRRQRPAIAAFTGLFAYEPLARRSRSAHERRGR